MSEQVRSLRKYAVGASLVVAAIGGVGIYDAVHNQLPLNQQYGEQAKRLESTQNTEAHQHAMDESNSHFIRGGAEGLGGIALIVVAGGAGLSAARSRGRASTHVNL